MKICLATTGITEFWSKYSDLLLLGPWCLTGKKNRQLLHGKSYSIVPSPWKPAIKIKKAEHLCRNIYEETIPELAVQLNKIHGVSYPDKYWRTLVGVWLVHFIEILYERYTRIENVIALFPNVYSYTLPKSFCRLSSVDTQDFVTIRGKATQDYYNLKLFSLILYYLHPDKAIEKEVILPLTENRNAQYKKYFKGMFYKVKKIRDVFVRPDIILSDMYSLNYMQILALELKSAPASIVFKDFNSKQPSKGDKDYSEKQRCEFRLEDKLDQFQTLLRRLIPYAIPMCYLENFKKYKSRVKTKNVKAVGSAVGWYFNESFKFFAAEEEIGGAKLIDFQHGGGYGILLVCPPENISLERDVFYTWGWRTENSKNTVPLSSPYLSKLKDTYKGSKNNILLVGNNVHRYLCRFFSFFTPDDIPQYFSDKKIFFYSLDDWVQRILLYRSYQEIGWNEVSMIKELIPDIKFLSKGRLVDYMKRAKIVVIDHLSTTNIEALTINAPTIWFWDTSVNLIRPEAEKYFELLREAGILYETPEEAARKINEICHDPLIWWQSPKVQNAKNMFCEKFAATSKNWRKEWMDALNAFS